METKRKTFLMKIVCVQGLGFVGSAMAVAIASGNKNLKVIGLEKNNERGKDIINKINYGKLPFTTEDKNLVKEFKKCSKNKKIIATVDQKVIKDVDVIVSNINLDLNFKKKKTECKF